MFKKFRSRKSNKAGSSAPADASAAPTSPDRKVSTGSSFSYIGLGRDPPSQGPPASAHQGGYSQLAPSSSERRPSPLPDAKRKTLGLHSIHQPEQVAPLDIIFVHGLGGDCRKTWSKNHDLSLFWPEFWLPFEPDIGKARIFSFGYNAGFRGGTTRSNANIADFAKELLYEMKFGKDEQGKDLGTPIGRVPIVFVAHSMGGLVVKKAYLLGQNDEAYQDIVRSISAIIFLATPHRGTNLAETLNRVLTVSFQSPKNFIVDLNKSSSALEELNEQFRHIAPKLSIFSFYETLATSVGPKKIMVLEKDTSILGYSKEISKPLDADHHDVCKYNSPEDPNYVSVRNALKALVGRYRSKGAESVSNLPSEEAKDIQKLFGLSAGPEDDFNNFRRWWIPGTCDWLLENPSVQSWLEESPQSRVVWFNAAPGSGKSILCSHVISHLRDSGAACQYFFFRFGDQTKRSLSMLLRSIAYQAAREIPALRRVLIDLSTEGLRLNKADPTLIWLKIFQSIIFEMELSHPLYWIIDALDESESPNALLDLLRSLPNSRTPVHVLIVSRKTESLRLAFDRLSDSVPVDMIEKESPDQSANDIRMLVEKEIKHMSGSHELKRKVIQSILDRAEGNFLWVRLVVEEILSCHTEEAIQETLDEIPSDMTNMYQHMELSILNHPRKSHRPLAKAIFQCTICAHRSLTLKELSKALGPEFPEFIDLRRTIQDVCGQFILVDPKGRVAMVHQTARDYLTKTSSSEISIDQEAAHTQLFTKTVSTLLEPKLRYQLTHGERALRNTNPFVFYAATSWTYHLRHSGRTSDDMLDMLVKLFNGPAVLMWIHTLALLDQLEVLVKAAKVLSKFVSKHRKFNDNRNPMLHRLSDLELLDQWIVDLVKVVGKFSRHLLLEPSAIYKLVPPFCPESSVLRKQFHHLESADISVTGISYTTWSDNLARITLSNGDQAWKISCAGQYIAVLGSTGNIFVWNSNNFTEVCTLRQQEPVTAMCFNNKGSKLVAYGLRTTKLWSIPSGQVIACTANPLDSKAMAMVFADNETKIVTGSDDKQIRYLLLDGFSAGWQVLDPVLLKESIEIGGAVANSPMCLAFSGDASLVGVSYRGYPLSVWALDELRCIGKCRRAKEFRGSQSSSSAGWFAVDRFTWNPVSGHIIGIYRDGCIFKWHPVTNENKEVQSAADEVAASSDGRLFVTSSSNGTVRVWNFAYFSVIYQLASDDLVTCLAFSPNCQRFYDVRGPSINAWESNSTIRFSEIEESFSDSISEERSVTAVSQASEACLVQYEAVSVLAAAPNCSLYCVGNEEGVVDLFDASTGKTIELLRFCNFLNVSHLAWADDGKHVIAADLGGDIAVKRLLLPPCGESNPDIEVKHLPSPKFDLEGRGIHQVLFNCDSTLLLTISGDLCQIWAVEEGIVRASTTLENGNARKWLKHPTKKHLFLGFGVDDVRVFQWHDFAEQPSLHFQQDRQRLDSATSFCSGDDRGIHLAELSLEAQGGHKSLSSVNKAMLTQDGKFLMVQIKEGSTQSRITKSLLLFDISVFESEDAAAPLIYSYIPEHIAVIIEYPLGVITGERLVFLDQDLWVCTFKLRSVYDKEALKRHYFIPRDWASSESLEQCCMMKDETLLCPKDDRVAVIKGSLEATGF